MDEIQAELLLRRDQAGEQLDFHKQRVTELQAQYDSAARLCDDYEAAVATIAQAAIVLAEAAAVTK